MSRLPRALISAISVVAFTHIASAADLPRKAPAYTPAPPVLSWTGWYVGLNAGAGWGNNDGIDNNAVSPFCILGVGPGFVCNTHVATDALVAAIPLRFDTGNNVGFIGGGQIGYNWQSGALVWGIEADFQGANLGGSGSAANTVGEVGLANSIAVAGTGSQKLNFLGTLRGRLGWTPSAPWLLYVTAGLAYGHVETDVSFNENILGGGCGVCPPAFSSASNNEWRAGWTVGGGVEWMIAPRWSLKGEYLYYDLGHVTLNTTIVQTLNGLSWFGVGTQSAAHYNGSIARAGINYHF